MKKVLLLNRKNTDNLGDIAIGESMHELLSSHDYEVYHLEFSTYNSKKIEDYNYSEIKSDYNKIIKFSKTLYNRLPKLIKWKLRSGFKLLKSFKEIPFKEIDIVIIGGGQLILSYPFFDEFSYSTLFWFLANKFFMKSKFILFGVGAGDYYSKTARKIYGYILPRVNGIYVRDFKSKETLAENFHVESKVVPDVAFSYSNILPLVNSDNSNVVLIGIYEYDTYSKLDGNNLNYTEYMDFWANSILEYENKGYEVKLFYTTGQDRIQTQKLSNYLCSRYNKKYEIEEAKTVKELVQMLNKAKIVYSARMHALILAKVYNCEVVVFPVNNKLKIFDEMYVSSNISLIEINKEIETRLKDVLN